MGSALRVQAQNQTVNGDLSVTGTVDVDGNTLTFGTQSTSYGAGFIYADSDTDTLSFHLNRSTASWLWAHSSAINAMRLNASHELVLYKSDGSTAGITLLPSSSTLSLGGSTLYRDGGGALTTNAALNVGGAFSATTFAASGGTITGGSNGLTLNAGGSGNQNITLTPTGAGYTLISGNLGIGPTAPQSKLHISGSSSTSDLLIGSGDSGSGNNTFLEIKRSVDTGGHVSIEAFRSGISGTTLALNPSFGGKVGIGTPTPSHTLEVVNWSGDSVAHFRGVAPMIDLTALGATNGAYVRLFPTAQGGGYIGTWSDRPLNLVANASTIATFATSGNVGIGTTNPTTKLDVAGDIRTSGNLIEKSITFTPTTVGWYRIVSTWQTDGGTIRIFNRWYDNTVTDLEFQYNNMGYGGRGSIQQTRYSSYNGGVVNRVRISSNGDSAIYVDIYINTASSPQPVTLYAYGPNFNGFVTNPVVGATAGVPSSVAVLELGHGFKSTHPDFYIMSPSVPGSGAAYAALRIGTNDNGGNFQYPIAIAGIAEGTPSPGWAPSAMAFFTGGNNGPAERMRITSNGETQIPGQMKVTGPILIPAQGDLPMGDFTQGPQPTF